MKTLDCACPVLIPKQQSLAAVHCLSAEWLTVRIIPNPRPMAAIITRVPYSTAMQFPPTRSYPIRFNMYQGQPIY